MKSLKLGSRGPEVAAFQRSLNRLGFKCSVDGHFGKKTLKAAQDHAADRTRNGAPGWQVMAAHDEAAKAVTAQTIKTVGAWCGSASLANPKGDVKFAADHGINRLDVVINDHSKWRTEKAFTVRDARKIGRLANAAAAKGIEVHLMSWIMPYRSYIEDAAEALIPLCKDVGAKSLQWDAEEPWMQARNALTHKAAAKIVKESFRGLSCSTGVNGIGYASVPKLGPLAAVSDYCVPQVYVTAKSGLKPESAPRKFYSRWKSKFHKPIVMGLAAYRQTGIQGHTVSSGMQACIDATRGVEVDTVIYWSLRWIRKSKQIADTVARIRG